MILPCIKTITEADANFKYDKEQKAIINYIEITYHYENDNKINTTEKLKS